MIRSVISISFESPYIILRTDFYTPFILVSPLLSLCLSLPSYLYLSLSPSLTPYLFFPVPYFLLSITYTPCISSVPSCHSASPSFILSLYYFFLLYSYISVPASTFTSLPSFPSFIFPHGYRPSLLSFLFFSFLHFYPFFILSVESPS